MKLLLQSGPVMTAEKSACLFSNYELQYVPYSDIRELNPKEFNVPVGSVEFTQEYASHTNVRLPSELSYPTCLQEFIYRPLRLDSFENASEGEFVKPYDHIKLFTGNKKRDISDISSKTKVWISPYVPFESEFRFYVNNYGLIGWSRYDDLNVTNPGPDINYVESIMRAFDGGTRICSYAIDIGWRPDLQKYDLIEINDGWALGFYNNTDPQSIPPKPQEYAQLLVSRWGQLALQ